MSKKWIFGSELIFASSVLMLLFCSVVGGNSAEGLPVSIPEALKSAIGFAQQNQVVAAIEILEKALVLPGTPEDYAKIEAFIGAASSRTGRQPDKAIEYLKKALEYDPDFEYCIALYDGELYEWRSVRPPQDWLEKVNPPIVPGLPETPGAPIPPAQPKPSLFVVALAPRMALGDVYYFWKGDKVAAIREWEKYLNTHPEAERVLAMVYRARQELGLAGILGNAPPVVVVDGVYFLAETIPIIEKGCVLVELKSICKDLKVELTLQPGTNHVMLNKDGKAIRFQVASKEAFIKGQKLILDVPPRIVNGHLTVPLRLVAEAFGARVRWDEKAKIAYVFTQPAS